MDFELIMLILSSVVIILCFIGFTIYESVKERRERKKTWAKIDNNSQPPAPYIEQLAHKELKEAKSIPTEGTKEDFDRLSFQKEYGWIRVYLPVGIKNAMTIDELKLKSFRFEERYININNALISASCYIDGFNTTTVVRKGKKHTAYYIDKKERISQTIPEKSNSQPAKHYDSMSGLEFEQFCSELLKKNGFINVKTTSGSGDNGVDILAEKDSVTYAIQCKCYSQNIGNKAVQEIYSRKDFYKRHVGIVMTNQYFTPSAKEAAERTGIILWDRDYVEKLKS